MAGEVLTTTAPTKPGVYIGKIYRNQPGPAPGFRRYVSLVGKGNRYQSVFNVPIRRSFLEGVQLTFTSVSPHTATLSYLALPDQTIARLYKANGTPVANTKWQFTESVLGSGNYDTILILPDVFDASTTYYIDYQSTDRTIRDALPFSDLRQITVVGDTENQDRYQERVHFYVPVTITTPAASLSNLNSDITDHAWSPVTLGGRNTSVSLDPIADSTFTTANAGTVTTADVTMVSTAPTHYYNRRYRLVVGSAASPFTMYLIAEQNSGGNDSKAQVPLHTQLPNALYPATMTDTATAGVLNNLAFTDPEIGAAINIDFDLTVNTPVGGDSYLVTALGHSLIEVDQTLTNAQWAIVSTPVAGVGNTGTGTVVIRDDSYYTDVVNRTYRLVCTTAAGVTPNRTATFMWEGWGEYPVVQGSFSISEATATNNNVAFSNGINLNLQFGATHFVVGDTFEFEASAARRYITAKDSRNYTFTVSSVAAGSVAGTYVTDTTEGSFGNTVTTGPAGEFALPGDIRLWMRNIGSTLAQNRYAANDVWTWTTSDLETMDWSLTERTVETIPVSKVYTDNLGLATGVVGAPFVVLANLPTSVLYVKDSVTDSLIAYTLVSGKPIIRLPAVPANAIEVSYEYIGLEPAPGQFYYVSANILRPAAAYNTPIFFSNYEDQAALYLGPSATDNDLMIAAQITLQDNGAPGIYTIQVSDSDGDGVYTTADYDNALNKVLSVSKNTDLIVLGKADTLAKQMIVNEDGNNPFSDHVNLALWVGMPTGSIIGDVDTPGSIVYTAKRTLQTPLTSQARGTRALVAHSEAVKTITLSDGTQVDVTLDGSFVAAGIAGLNASFTDPNTLLLDQVLGGFKSINTFNEDERLTLIDASAIHVYNDGSEDAPVYKITEGVTVDKSSDDLHEINVAFNVRTFTTADMREHLRQTTIGILPDSAEDGVNFWRTQIVLRLNYWFTQRIIGSYEDENGNPRELDPNLDVQVFRSKTSKTQYAFKYAWFGRYGSTRGFGLYAVDVSNIAQPI